MIDRSASLVNLLSIYSDTERARCLVYIADRFRVWVFSVEDDRMLILKIVRFKGNRAKKLTKEFLNEGWDCRDWTIFWKKLREKLVRLQDEVAAFDHELRERTTTLTLFCFYSNIRTQTEYYKKGISRLVANLLNCNTTKYYYKMLSYRRETALQGAL